MPLARIFTHDPEHASDLSQQLQLEGFSVEIAAPDSIHLHPADLEIDFDICNPAETLQLASRKASELKADVVVASGVLDLAMQSTDAASVELRPAEVAEVNAQPEPIQMVPVEAVPLAEAERKERTPLQWRGIFTGAAAASMIFVVGLVLANVHRQSPLPADMTQTSGEQHVPFGAIIVQGRPAQSSVTVAPPKTVTPPPKIQTRESSQAAPRQKPHPYQRRAAARESGDNVTADDVTVRHFPAPTKRPIQQQARFKRYSDLE